jgi:hypothetical protein
MTFQVRRTSPAFPQPDFVAEAMTFAGRSVRDGGGC